MAKGLVADFEGVESGGGGGARVPEDDYRLRVEEVKVGESKSSGNTMLIWTFIISKGKYKGKKLKKDYTTLTAEALWKLKGLLEALGFEVPSKKIDLAPILKKATGKECGATVIDDEYEGKMQSRISDYIGLDALEDQSSDDEDEDDEKPKKKRKKGKKSKKDDEDEIEDMDLDDI